MPRFDSTEGFSEHVFQRQLQYSWIGSGPNQAERCGGAHVRSRVAGIEMVRQVERLGPEFNQMVLTNPKFSGEAHINSDTSGTKNIGSAHISECACIRLRERSGVQPRYVVLRRSIRAGKHLIRTLRTEPGQSVIQTGRHRQITAG